VPVRPAIVGAIVGIAGVVGALTFASSLDGLVHDPTRYGWNWTFALDVSADDQQALQDVDGVRDIAFLDYAQVSIGDHQMIGMAMTPTKGSPGFTLGSGRLPGDGEVALGPATAEELGVSIGDEVALATSDGGNHPLRVVGEVLLPVIDDNPFNEGVAVTLAELDPIRQSEGGDPLTTVRFTEGVSEATAKARVNEILPEALSIYSSPTPPGDVANLDKVRGIPRALAIFLVVVALAAVGHAVATAVRRRRRDIGIVRALGFLRREVLTTVGVQSATLLAIGVIVGLPVGVALGRVIWTLVADGLGVPAEPTVPSGALIALVPAALLAAALIALCPALAAARQRAAHALRAE
jgi:ABC-type antimicrobial peptide transport system permease subunit